MIGKLSTNIFPTIQELCNHVQLSLQIFPHLFSIIHSFFIAMCRTRRRRRTASPRKRSAARTKTEWSMTSRGIFRTAARISRTLSCRSRPTMVFPFSRESRQTTISDLSSAACAHSREIPPIPKKGWSIENKEREKFEDEVAESGCRTRGELRLAKRRRARRKGQRRGPEEEEEKEGEGGQLHRGFTEAKGDEDFVQGSAFRLGRRGRDCPLLWYRAVGLVNFLIDAFLPTSTTTRRTKAKATRRWGQQHRDFIVLSRLYFIVTDCSFVSASLHPAERFFASTEKFRSSSLGSSFCIVPCIRRILSLQI